MAKRIAKIVGIALLVVVALAAALVIVLTVTEYKPAPEEQLDITSPVSDAGTAEGSTLEEMQSAANAQNGAPGSSATASSSASGTSSATAANPQQPVQTGTSLKLLSWNVGYCGLSSDADFFMDGGHSVRPVDEDGVKANLAGVQATVQAEDPDIVFLQEVDQNSTRSYHVNELQSLESDFGLQGYSGAYAPNYRTLFVPYPMPPLGKVDSGIVTLNRLQASSAERVSLPCPFSWPVSTANLKRCLLVERVPVQGSNKQLVLVNLHLEAYDSGEGKAAQTAQLAELLKSEYEKGNYVIAAGDFNQTFSTVDASAYPQQKEGLWQPGTIDANSFDPPFSLMMDARTPTCRSLDRPLDRDDPTFQYYMIDGCIVSSNVQVESLQTLDRGFAHADHNPVELQFSLE